MHVVSLSLLNLFVFDNVIVKFYYFLFVCVLSVITRYFGFILFNQLVVLVEFARSGRFECMAQKFTVSDQ
jgi:hypothetical protein